MKRHLTRNMTIMLVSLAVLGAVLFGFRSFKNFKIGQVLKTHQNPVVTVSTYRVKENDWQVQISAVGNMAAVNGTAISPELGGTVVKINFRSGQDVEVGDYLLGIDTRAEMATLEQLKAQQVLARQTLDRDLKQAKISAVSQQTIDDDRANLKALSAQVQQQLATIAYKNVRAPFSGRLGIRQVDLGQYVNPGDEIVYISQMDPLYVDFYIAQRQISKVEPGEIVQVLIDAFPDNKFTGKVLALDSNLQVGTGNIKVRAQVPNPDYDLIPGMYANVEVNVGKPVKKITVPQTVLFFNSYGATAFLAVDENKGKGTPKYVAKQVVVQTGLTRGDQIEVLSGLKTGDLVVSGGQLKLRNGTQLKINNKLQPPDNPNPKPIEQ
ncbi:efflux RND transporter periplasmic adaptor subunit [Flexibacterium corallicola]|uniref:efflux RND transporter periplasmic adaptor subunit n=1 Tax=Flexibacterium corallicola TaxID=3037259 RepID=UPI00286F4262|nr:efflux RND transporter periplasmic adaptor subunit [Pseudovibrio sp. M1P-2-3]